VFLMQHTTDERDEYWQRLSAYTFARNSRGAPWAVLRHVAALLGEHGIAESYVTYGFSEPSTWLILLVTEDARLIKLHAEFEAEQYDRDEELQPIRQSHPVVSTVREAWVRHLSDVARLDIGEVTGRAGPFGDLRGDQFNIGDVHLTFSDGQKEDLEISQATMSHDDRAKSDAFISALREAAKL